MISKSYLTALEDYSRLTLEYQAAKEAYDNNPSLENWDSLQEAIRIIKRQDEIIKLNRRLFEVNMKHTDL